jgi:curved DNA-binding protein CbpA
MAEAYLTHYQILRITPAILSSHADPISLLKQSYRRALLQHHPDKSRSQSQPGPSSSTRLSIDQITLAFTTLSAPHLRAKYDAHLRSLTSGDQSQFQHQANDFRTGIETIDLDDLPLDDASDPVVWYRNCRCGNPRGFHFTETDLEDASDVGELLVGCQDCSLWLRVQFAAILEESNEDMRNAT